MNKPKKSHIIVELHTHNPLHPDGMEMEYLSMDEGSPLNLKSVFYDHSIHTIVCK